MCEESRTLAKSLDTNPELDLSYKDKAFTIQLASDQVSIPARCRFLYRMKGDKSLIGTFTTAKISGSNTWALYGAAEETI